jgi:hypothetical protein
MNIIALAVAIVIVSIGVVLQQIRPLNSSDEIPVGSVLQSQITAPTPAPTTGSPSPTQVPTVTLVPTLAPTNEPPSTFRDFPIYPGASIVSSNDDGMTLTSSDDTDSITQWFKAYIEAQHMNVKSFVTTKANDKIHNVLVGAGNGELRVTITRDSGETKTTIVLSRS